VPVFPNPRALAVTQDRLVEKNLFRSLGIPVGEYAAVSTRDELDAQVAPAIAALRD
jgi:5-(carboxyamino)imidazole ribonucleotide synthase